MGCPSRRTRQFSSGTTAGGGDSTEGLDAYQSRNRKYILNGTGLSDSAYMLFIKLVTVYAGGWPCRRPARGLESTTINIDDVV